MEEALTSAQENGAAYAPRTMGITAPEYPDYTFDGTLMIQYAATSRNAEQKEKSLKMLESLFIYLIAEGD
ncbi:MAG: hypothetical protein R2741_09500 [Methanolobus sp.]